MISEAITALVSIVALLMAFAQRPTRAYCGNTWYVDRVWASGFYTCKRTVGYDQELDRRPAGWRVGWISCSYPQRAAILYDGLTVSCH